MAGQAQAEKLASVRVMVNDRACKADTPMVRV